MGINVKIILFVVGLIFLIFVFKSVKKNTFRPSYSLLWILISLFLISIPILESFYIWLAYSVINISDARNLVYIILIGFLLIYIFYLTTRVTKMADQIQELISFTAILEAKFNKEEKDLNTYKYQQPK